MSYAGQVNSYAQADKNAQDAALTVCTVDIGQVLSLSRSFTCSSSLSLSLQDMLTPLRRGVCVYTLIQGFWNVFSVILSARGCRGILPQFFCDMKSGRGFHVPAFSEWHQAKPRTCQ